MNQVQCVGGNHSLPTYRIVGQVASLRHSRFKIPQPSLASLRSRQQKSPREGLSRSADVQ